VVQSFSRFKQDVLMVDRKKRVIMMSELDAVERDSLRNTPALQFGTQQNSVLWDIQDVGYALRSEEEAACYDDILELIRLRLPLRDLDMANQVEQCWGASADTWKLAALILTQSVEYEMKGECGVPDLERYLQGGIFKMSPDHFHPFRALNPMTKLLCHYYGPPTPSARESGFWKRNGLSEVMTFHGFGQGWQTQDGLAVLKPPYHDLDCAAARWAPFGPQTDGQDPRTNVPVYNTHAWGATPAQSYSLDCLDENKEQLSMREMLEEYWSDEVQTQWEGWLAGGDHTWQSFNALLECLDKRNVHPSTLGGLQLANTLTIYGMVSPPSVLEMVATIAKLGKGAVAGLKSLGLPHTTPRDIAMGFIVFHQYLRSLFNASQRDLIHYSPGMTEHILCKIPRWVRLNLDW
ncbi:hypothetical protein V5O48_019245, partial [Marasmius crinis-equi]